MSLEEALAATTAALAANTAILERVVAGQEAAMAKLEGAKTGSTRRSTKKDAEPAAEPKAEEKKEEPAAAESPIAKLVASIGTDQEKMKAHVAGWTGSTEDKDERAKRVDLLKAMAAHFGGSGYGALVTSDDTAKQAIFYVERAKALGVGSVNLSAEYDFDGDPSQGGAAKADDDDFG